MEKRAAGYYEREYVKFIARKLMQSGYTDIRVMTESENFGADITAVTPKGKKVCVRCVYADDVLGTNEITGAIAAREYYKTDGVLVVTNWVFTNTAEEMAKQKRVALKRNFDFTPDTEIGKRKAAEAEREARERMNKEAKQKQPHNSVSAVNILAGVVLILLGWFLLFGCELRLEFFPL